MLQALLLGEQDAEQLAELMLAVSGESVTMMKRNAPEADIRFEMGMDLPAFGIAPDAA